MLEEFLSHFQSFQAVGADAFKPGLERMLFLDQMAGHPHRRYRTIHIAGTNGKGSVSNMLASAIAAHGLKVGLYTSPHILDVRERMRVIDADGVRLISEAEADAIISTWRDSYCNLGLSFFEVTTSIAFEWFARQNVDVAVIEAGLGGRLDSTNIITPELSVITNIGYDHCDILGSSLGEIAFEKAGIIKPKCPVVIGESSPETDIVFERKVLYTNLSEPEYMGDRQRIISLLHFADKSEPKGWERSDAILSRMDLQGCYQKKNLRTVLTALEVLGIDMDDEAIENTAKRMDFHGRWERLSPSATCPDWRPEVICDIGHNEHGLKYNFAQLTHLASQGRPIIIIYGSVADKDVDAVLRIMPECAQMIFFTNADSSRALPAESVCEHYLKCCDDAGRKSCPHRVVASVAEAVSDALDFAAGLRDVSVSDAADNVGLRDVSVSDAADNVGLRDGVVRATADNAGLRDGVVRATADNVGLRDGAASASRGEEARPLIYIGGSTYVVSEAVRCF